MNLRSFLHPLWGWSTIVKKLIFALLVLFSLSSCKAKEEILVLENKNESKDIVEKSSPRQFQIDGLYLVNKDTLMYDRPNSKKIWDRIKKGSSVKILENEKDGFVKVDYFGNSAYMKIEDLDINS